MKYIWPLFIFSLITSHVFAGGTVGNGGKVIVCNDHKRPEHLQLVDLYESQLLRNWIPKISDGATDSLLLAGLITERIKILNPSRYERYQFFLSRFMKEAQFISGQELIDIPDSNHPTYPENCIVKQLAIQRSPLTTKDPRYLINKDLWSQMNLVNQAGLILHEVIYREQISVGIDTSANARFINSALWSDQFGGMDQTAYFQFIKDFVPDIDLDGYNFAICRPGLINQELNQCERREPPRLKKSEDSDHWDIDGFILPPWSPLAIGKRQVFTMIDPINHARTDFITYGPYQKSDDAIVFSQSANWLTQTGVNQMTYAGHQIQFHTNVYPDIDKSSMWTPKEKKCYELWECQFGELEKENIKAVFDSTESNWSRITATPSHQMLNFNVDYLNPPAGSVISSCRGLVNLREDGRISRCTGDGFYKDQDVELAFDKTFTGWNEHGQIEFAIWMKKAKLFFQNKWVQVTTLDWAQQNHTLHNFTIEQPLRANVESQNIIFPRGNFTLNSEKQIIRFQTGSKNSVKMKIGGHELNINLWYLCGSDPVFDYIPFTPGTYWIRLVEPTTLKDSSGKSNIYQPGWSLTIDKNAIILQCQNLTGGVCF